MPHQDATPVGRRRSPRVVVSPARLGAGPGAGVWRPGGGLNPRLVAGRQAGLVEKRHLVLKRRFALQAANRDQSFIDLGTDYSYPYFDAFAPTRAAIDALTTASDSARHYPSSYGTEGLRAAAAGFLERWFGVEADPFTQVMVSTGASQVFDALSRTYAGRAVIVPDLALSTVTSIAVGNGAQIPAEAWQQAGPVPVLLQSGEAIAFDPCLLHASDPNRSDRSRRALMLRYQRAGTHAG